jgi:type IV secretory pathway TraG/TraD family ATPase VirD4
MFGIIRGGSAGHTVQPLLTPDQLMMRYSSDLMLILPQGSYPIEAKRVPYYRDRRFANLWDDPRTSEHDAAPDLEPMLQEVA